MKYLILSLTLLILPACSSDTKSSPPPPTPPEQCLTLVETICKRDIECGAQITEADCEKSVQTNMACPKATGVSKSYSQCLVDIPATPCSIILITTPVTCSGAVTVP